jgi:hypothetical protein
LRVVLTVWKGESGDDGSDCLGLVVSGEDILSISKGKPRSIKYNTEN